MGPSPIGVGPDPSAYRSPGPLARGAGGSSPSNRIGGMSGTRFLRGAACFEPLVDAEADGEGVEDLAAAGERPAGPDRLTALLAVLFLGGVDFIGSLRRGWRAEEHEQP